MATKQSLDSIRCLILVARVLERMILDLRALLLIEKVHIGFPKRLNNGTLGTLRCEFEAHQFFDAG